MAEILINGGVTVVPQRPKGIITAYRALEDIRRQLLRFHDSFALPYERHPPRADKKSLRPLQTEAIDLKTEYLKILTSCAQILEGQFSTMPAESRAYYGPLLKFLALSNDAHTGVPFVMDVVSYYNYCSTAEHAAALGKPYSHDDPVFDSPFEHKAFVEEKIMAAVRRCDAYKCLLSTGLDSQIELFNLGSLIGEVLTMERIEAMSYSVRNLSGPKQRLALTKDYFYAHAAQNIHPIGYPSNIKPLVHFLMENLVSNAFKASFGAAARFDKIEQVYPQYSGCITREPHVEVKVFRKNDTEIAVVISDNGIGIPKEKLPALFDSDEKPRIFKSFQYSNGSTTELIPFIADLTGISIRFTSNVGQGTTVELTIPVSLHGY